MNILITGNPIDGLQFKGLLAIRDLLPGTTEVRELL